MNLEGKKDISNMNLIWESGISPVFRNHHIEDKLHRFNFHWKKKNNDVGIQAKREIQV